MIESHLAPISEIVEEARNGRMVVLVDDDERDNEGTLILPAQMVTPASVNFMATHGRGLVCLALTQDRADRLGLSPMTARDNGHRRAGFTASIEARTGVTTGISAADRARTVSVAVSASSGPDDIVSPGHVFPLVAKAGGVLTRAGHTEAAVDIARLAGLDPSGVSCEIMNDDGSMARLADLIAFAAAHGIKIGAIRDLIAYRYRHDHLIDFRAETPFESRNGGHWVAKTYQNRIDGSEHIVLQKGAVDPMGTTLVRMHVASMMSDMFGEVGERNGLLERSMEIIGQAGGGLIVILRDPASLSISGLRRVDPDPPVWLRDYGIGARILADLGVGRVELLTNSTKHPVNLSGYGLEIVGRRPIPLDPGPFESQAVDNASTSPPRVLAMVQADEPLRSVTAPALP